MAGLNEVKRNIDKWYQRKRLGSYEMAQNVFAPMLENYGKANRPWTDRTGNARRGLTAEARLRGSKELSILFYHTMWYGKDLELDRGGKYAILAPTMRKHKATILKGLEEYWNR